MNSKVEGHSKEKADITDLDIRKIVEKINVQKLLLEKIGKIDELLGRLNKERKNT